MQNMMKTYLTTLGLSLALSLPAFAQDHSAHAGHGAPQAPAAAESTSLLMTAGEVTRVDTRTGKLTIRHEDIQNLNMPAMTMVFTLAGSAQPAAFKAGDKVIFHAEEKEGALVITRIQPAP